MLPMMRIKTGFDRSANLDWILPLCESGLSLYRLVLAPYSVYYTQGRVTSRQPRVAVRELCLRAWQQGGAPLAPRRLLHGSKLLLRSSCRRLRGGPGSNIIGGLLAGGVYSDPPYCGVPCEARDICSRAELCRSPQRKAPVFSPNSAEHGDAT